MAQGAGFAYPVHLSRAHQRPCHLQRFPWAFFLTSHQITQSAKNAGWGLAKMGGFFIPPPPRIPLPCSFSKSTLLLYISALYRS